MNGRGNYSNPNGLGSYTPISAFQHPVASSSAAAPRPLPGPFSFQLPVIQQNAKHENASHHAFITTPHRPPQVVAVLGGLNSSESFIPHIQLPKPPVSSDISQLGSASGQQKFTWVQSICQNPSVAPVLGPNLYPVPGTHWRPSETGAKPRLTFRPPFQLVVNNSPSLFASDPQRPSMSFMTQCSNPQSTRLMLPPAVTLSSSPASGLRPAPSFQPSVVLSKNERVRYVKGSEGEKALMTEHLPSLNSSEGEIVQQMKATHAETEKNELEAGSDRANNSGSRCDSDTDMEDDFTLSYEEQKNSSNNLSNCSRGDDVNKQLLQEQAVSLPNEELSAQPVEIVNIVKLMKGLDSGSTENEGGTLLTDGINHSSTNDVFKYPKVDKQPTYASEVPLECHLDFNKHMLPVFSSQSPKVSVEAGEFSMETGKSEENSPQESVVIGVSFDHLSENSSRKYDVNVGLEGPDVNKYDIKSTHATSNIDEFGRLIRQGVSDSDTSDSPRERSIRRTGRRKRSESRSRSPVRRRSPLRREKRRRRSRSFSPRTRRRSRSKSPVPWRDHEFTGDRLRCKKTRLLPCFNFRRGRCYRGPSCHFSHQVFDRNESTRFTRRLQKYQTSPPISRRPDFHKREVLIVKEVKDEGLKLHNNLPVSDEAKASKELSGDGKRGNLSACPAHSMPSEEKASFIPGHPHAQNYVGASEIVDRSDNRKDAFLRSQSFVSLEQSASASDRHSVDPLDVKWGHTGQQPTSASPLTKYQTSEEVPLMSQELPMSISYHPPSSTVPSVSEVMTTAQCSDQAHDIAPNAYKQPQFPSVSGTSMSSFLPASHQPNNHLPAHLSGEKCLDFRDILQSSLLVKDPAIVLAGQSLIGYQSGSLGNGPDMSNHVLKNFESNGTHLDRAVGHQYDPIVDKERHLGDPVQSSSTTYLFFPSQSNSSFVQPSLSGFHNSVGGLPLDGRFFHNHPNYQANITGHGGENPLSLLNSGLPAASVSERPQGGDQYDPLLDSIEPALTPFSGANQGKNEVTGDSDDTAKPLILGTLKQDGGTGISVNVSPENDECAGTGDAEVRAVFNESPSSSPSPSNDGIDFKQGGIEVNQIKVWDSKKPKSVKLFKRCIASFVKEVLKPSWRQGNMSKEAFKTIVKKTVDKVSEAMRRHKVPKSQEKIDRYINSSRGKLTRLVMGYVDKYVKT